MDINADILHFFVDEVEKLGGDSDAARRRHQYYMRNRNRILSQQRMYRKENMHSSKRRQKRYRREINSGMKRQRQRVSTGNSYTYGGYR